MRKRRPRISVNDKFFKNLNFVNCYWAGFIAADGCISPELNRLTINLAIKDIKILENFKNNIGYKGNIYRFEKYCSIKITSAEIISDLEKNFNIIKRKTYKYCPPENLFENPDLIDAFICGYIDGDGYIGLCPCKSESKSFKDLSITIVGTYDCMKFIQRRFCQISDNSAGGFISNHKNSKITYCLYLKNRIARTIFKHYYNLEIPKLKRKWSEDKIEFCNLCDNLKFSNQKKPIHIFDEMLNYICTCSSLTEASEKTNISVSYISFVCDKLCSNGKPRTAHGYIFTRHINYPVQQI